MILTTIYLTLVLGGLFIKTGRLYRISTISFLSIVVLINTDHSDYLAYRIAYEQLQGSLTFQSFEPGFQVLCHFGNAIGIPYNVFAFTLTIVALIGICFASSKIAVNSNLGLALFLIYPALISLVQFRQFLALACVVLSIIWLLKGEKRYTILSVVAFLVACSLHATSAAFLVIFLLRIAGSKRKPIYVLYCILFLILSFSMFSAYGILSQLFDADKVTIYFDGYTGYTGLFAKCLTALIIISFAVVSILCHRQIKSVQEPISNVTSIMRQSFSDITVMLNLFFVALIPLMMISTTFMRLHRVVVLMVAIQFASAEENASKSLGSYIRILAVAIVFFAPEFYYVFMPSFKDVIASLLIL